MNLGIVQNSLKRFQAAEQSYRTAIKHRRKYPDCYYNLGRLVSLRCPAAAEEKRDFVSPLYSYHCNVCLVLALLVK